MERTLQFTEASFEYALEDAALAGPHTTSIIVEVPVREPQHLSETSVVFEMSVEQGLERTIAVIADHPIYWSCLLKPLSILERLLVILEGSFIPLKRICYACPEGPTMATEENCETVNSRAMTKRLSYFTSSKLAKSQEKLVNFWDVLTPEFFERWRGLLEELDIAYPVYLYALSDNGVPVDLSMAFLVELAEPFVDVLSAEHHPAFTALTAGRSTPKLKQCLRTLIESYGQSIFHREINNDYESFLQKMVDSRVRIMHIKRNRSEDKFYDYIHCVYYIWKLSLLYRVILLDLLDVPESIYAEGLKKSVKAFDRWLEDATRYPKACGED